MEHSTQETEMEAGNLQPDSAPPDAEAFCVVASGELLIGRISEFRMRLLESIAASEWTIVDCSRLTDADLTFFQLLCSAHRTATSKKKILTLAGHEKEPFSSIAEKLGLRRHVGCALDVLRSCLWKGECKNG